jgi:hypothetical protein
MVRSEALFWIVALTIFIFSFVVMIIFAHP